MTNPKLDLNSSLASPRARFDRGFAGSAQSGRPAAVGSRVEPHASTLRGALLAVYELHSRDRPADAGSVARQLGVSPCEAAHALLALDAKGLLWAERCRLTMAGLSMAARLSAQRNSARRRAA